MVSEGDEDGDDEDGATDEVENDRTFPVRIILCGAVYPWSGKRKCAVFVA